MQSEDNRINIPEVYYGQDINISGDIDLSNPENWRKVQPMGFTSIPEIQHPDLRRNDFLDKEDKFLLDAYAGGGEVKIINDKLVYRGSDNRLTTIATIRNVKGEQRVYKSPFAKIFLKENTDELVENWAKENGYKVWKEDFGNSYEGGGSAENENEVYIEFLNKEKNFTKDKKSFKTYEDAVKWARKNFDKFNPDMIRYYSVGGSTKPNPTQKIKHKDLMNRTDYTAYVKINDYGYVATVRDLNSFENHLNRKDETFTPNVFGKITYISDNASDEWVYELNKLIENKKKEMENKMEIGGELSEVADMLPHSEPMGIIQPMNIMETVNPMYDRGGSLMNNYWNSVDLFYNKNRSSSTSGVSTKYDTFLMISPNRIDELKSKNNYNDGFWQYPNPEISPVPILILQVDNQGKYYAVPMRNYMAGDLMEQGGNYVGEYFLGAIPLRDRRNVSEGDADDISSYNQGTPRYNVGGQLKPIPEGNKGLPKLPEEVRNRMGYMDNGGMAEEKQMSRTILNDSVHKLIKKNGTDIMKYSQFELSTLDSYVSHRDISEQLAETIWGLAIKNGFNGYMSRVLIINSGTGKILNYVNNDFSKVDAVNPSNDENIIATLLNNIQVIDIHSDSLKLLNHYDLGIIINKNNADLSNLKMVCTKLKSNNMLIFVAPMNILYGENPIKNFINEKFDLVQAFCDESTNSCISVLKKM